jgi:DNA-binding MarR family transcriptional regulator
MLPPSKGAAKPMDSDASSRQDSPRTIYLLAQAGRGVARELDKAFSSLPLTPMQYTVLSILDRRGPLSNAELSRRFFVTAQSMNEALTALSKAGYVSRTEDPKNRRILRTHLTPSGHAILRTCDRVVEEVEVALLSNMAAKDVDLLRGLMRAVLDHVRHQGADEERS